MEIFVNNFGIILKKFGKVVKDIGLLPMVSHTL